MESDFEDITSATEEDTPPTMTVFWCRVHHIALKYILRYCCYFTHHEIGIILEVFKHERACLPHDAMGIA